MNNLIFLVLLLIGFSCAHKGDEDIGSGKKGFLSRDEVLDEVNNFSPDDIMDEPLTQEDMVRSSNLIPDSEFLKDFPMSDNKSFQDDRVKDDAPEAIDLRSRDTKISSQDNGKCTAWGGIAAVENLLQKNGPISGLNLSEWHAWSFYRQYSSVAFIKALTNPNNRVGDERDYPQYGKAKKSLTPHTYISDEDNIGDSPGLLVEALKRGNPVYIAMKTPNDLVKCKKVISPFSSAANGGHAMAISGYYLDKKTKEVIAILKNSWGKNCGDLGYQYLPISICRKNNFYCSMWEIKGLNTNKVLGFNRG